MTNRQRWTPVVALLAVAAATALWSCGGSAEGPTSPLALQEGSAPAAAVPGQGDDGGVTSSGTDKITVCHKGSDKEIPTSALGGHLVHGDKLGSCRAAACPCFSSEGLDTVAAKCTLTVSATCPGLLPYSLQLFCSAGGGVGSAGNMGLFEARVGDGVCRTTTRDPLTGIKYVGELPVSPAEQEACREAIVGSSHYPPTCPR